MKGLEKLSECHYKQPRHPKLHINLLKFTLKKYTSEIDIVVVSVKNSQVLYYVQTIEDSLDDISPHVHMVLEYRTLQ